MCLRLHFFFAQIRLHALLSGSMIYCGSLFCSFILFSLFSCAYFAGYTIHCSSWKSKSSKMPCHNQAQPDSCFSSIVISKTNFWFRWFLFWAFFVLAILCHAVSANSLLLLRELKQPNPHEIFIGVAGMKLRFGIEEFALWSQAFVVLFRKTSKNMLGQ